MIRTKLITLIILLLFAGLLGFINLTSVQPYGMFGEGRDYCYNLTQEGYFEGQHDTANHRNCTIGYEYGIHKDKKWSCPFRENCFSYDDYDDVCEKNIDMKDYGMRCVWGGLGWMATAGTMALWGMVAMIIVIVLATLWSGGEDEQKEGHKLIGVVNETN